MKFLGLTVPSVRLLITQNPIDLLFPEYNTNSGVELGCASILRIHKVNIATLLDTFDCLAEVAPLVFLPSCVFITI